MADDKHKHAIRTELLKVLHVDDPAAYDRWHDLARDIQRTLNRLWLAVLMHHEKAKSGPKLRKWMQGIQDRAKGGSKKGKAPTCPVPVLPKALVKSLSAFIRKECPNLNSRCVALAIRKETQDLAKHKSMVGAFRRWHYALAGYGDVPSYARPQPIPFNRQNGKLIPPNADEKCWVFELRLDYYETTTRDGKPKAASHTDRIVIATQGRKLTRIRTLLGKLYVSQELLNRKDALLNKIAEVRRKAAREVREPSADEVALAATYNREVEEIDRQVAKGAKLCGSSLALKRKGWFIDACWQEPQEPAIELDPDRVAWFAPARKHPWSLVVPDDRRPGRCYKLWLLGRGRFIEWLRRNLGYVTATKSESYRYGSKSRKGHGLKRAVHEARNRLANGKKTWNEQTVAQLIRVLQDRRIGTLKFVSPNAQLEKTRFLVTAGASARHPDSWNWHQVKTLLERKCQEAGVTLVMV